MQTTMQRTAQVQRTSVSTKSQRVVRCNAAAVADKVGSAEIPWAAEKTGAASLADVPGGRGAVPGTRGEH